ncbi:hypothetical protein B7486_00760 [cyanobacterium TDX16]|nr:hypothetical protein B7486_00760 [cyanobacterium TDX16]
MASKQAVWGIDVGQCMLKAIKLQQSGEQVEMLGFDVVEHANILSEGEGDSTQLITDSLKTFLSRNNISDSRVVVSVPGQQTLTRFTKMPPVEPKKIPDMVQYEASQQIPFDIDEVVWDYQVFVEKESPDVEVGIFAIRKELIRNYLILFTQLGIEPFIVQTGPMAAYNAARSEQPEEMKESIVILDMGALATDLIVMEGNRIWSRPIPIGGNRFTESLVTAFKISFKKAEKLKRTAATSKYARQVFQAMRPVFADLVSEVQRSVGYYTSTHRDARIGRVVGMGNAFKLPGLQKFLQQNLQLEVDRFSGFSKLVTGGQEQSPAFAENILSFPGVYGLALQGLGLAKVTSSLLPLEVQRTILWRKKRPWFAASAACLALAGGSVWVGNVLANNQLQAGLGNLTNIAVMPVSTTQQAEQILNSAVSEAPVERAAKIAGAAQYFSSKLSDVERLKVGDRSTLVAMSTLPENNIYLPRVLEIIHRGFAEAQLPEFRNAKSPREFLAAAKSTTREDREDIWIEKLDMVYHPQDPEAVFTGQGTPGRGRDGWAIRIEGGTTMAQPAKWIDNRLIKSLERVGRIPSRAIYLDKATLATVMERKKTSAASSFDAFTPPEDDSRGGGRGRGGGRPPARGGDDRGTGGRGGRGGRGGPLPGTGGGGPVDEPSGGGDISTQVNRLREKYKSEDPLTGEPIATDQRFVLEIIIRRSDTPANLIPEEFKPKADEKAAETKRG